ncbi:MAG: cysteine desulfurase / selenocysteine lyase [Thermoplasmata archaeon]|jgi:cysteine desulfurase/selenocysteine lyase|nr:cysteine desulfurase / selenocysteine lyase [Thermoplasmata archaeon]
MLDVNAVRKDFPILDRKVSGGKRLVYLDNAATTQKPLQVLDAMDRYYRETNSNVHRSIHELGERATEQYVAAHERVAEFIGARSYEEIIFTKNCTEALNLVAYSKGLRELKAGDEVVISQMEHHSNFVPWLEVCRLTGAKLRIVPVTAQGRLDMQAYAGVLSRRTRLVAMTAMSNVLGTITPAAEIVKLGHEAGATVLLDGAQSVPHGATDVQATQEDFLAFSAHKMLGPTGIGVLYGKREQLDRMAPFLFGGEMIGRVTNQGATWNDLPWKFEAGTPVIAEAVGLAAACDYLDRLGMDAIHAHEAKLVKHAFDRLAHLPVKILGPPASERGGLVAVEMEGIHAHDLASLLNDQGVAVRAGHHCAQPLMESLGIASTVRASFYVYNTLDEVDAFVAALEHARKVFQL